MSDQLPPADQPSNPPQQWSAPPPPAPGAYPPPAPGGYTPPPNAYPQPAPTPAGPDNYLVWVILTFIFCCSPISAFAIWYSAKVNALAAGGDMAGAEAASNTTKKLLIWSVAAWVVGVALYFLFLLFIAAVGGSSTPSNRYSS